MTGIEPQKILRGVLDACADCDTCRFLMDESCLLFPELYRLYDQEKETGKPVQTGELRKLAERCTLCGLCPCPNIRADVIRGKTEWVKTEGMPLHIRLLADVQGFARWGSQVPRVVNKALSMAPVCRVAKKMAGIHPQRSMPRLPDESFFAWAHKRGLDREPDQGPKVAYFAGCTAGYLFPQVARAAVGILQRNGVSVYVPPQHCCGMPTLLEGDKATTLERVGSNIETLLKTVRAGFDIVCSCPTCGFLMKVLLKEGAFYSGAYQRAVGAAVDEIKVPGANTGGNGFVHLKKSIYGKILSDAGYFAAIDPLGRIALSESVLDMGEFLERSCRGQRLNTGFATLDGRMAYYVPCHQREQDIGNPYLGLLTSIPGLTITPVGSAIDCCGMGGSLGFKADFHHASVKLGAPLMQKIRAAEPEAVVTDCLSCRLQFQHLLPYPVFHPLEILWRAYETSEAAKGDNMK